MRIARYTGLRLCGLLIIAGFLHQYTVGFDTDRTLLYISLYLQLFIYLYLEENLAEKMN